MLTISADYFNLQKPTDRRIYELARKHCGNQSIWRIKLENLKEKIGSTSSIRKFRFNIKKVTETNHLPEYNIAIEDDVVTFTRKALPKENNLPEQLPQYITKKQMESQALPGETYQQVEQRLKQSQNAVAAKNKKSEPKPITEHLNEINKILGQRKNH
jgi:plasmid replication initiation protein